MKTSTLAIAAIILFGCGFAVSSIWFTPEVETTTDTRTDSTEVITETIRDTVYIEKIVPDTIFVRANLDRSESSDSITTTKASYSDRNIGLLANIKHSGYIYDVGFEYIQKTQVVRETQNLKIIEREISTVTTVTRTIKPPILNLQASTIISPSVLAVTGGIQYHSVGIQVGQDFNNSEPIGVISISFSPSKLIKRLF